MGDKKFWNEMRRLLAKGIRRDYTNPKRKVESLIADRKIELSMLEIGDEDKESTYTTAMDDWITAVEMLGTETNNKKETARKLAPKVGKGKKVWDNLMRRMGNKWRYSSYSFSSSSSFPKDDSNAQESHQQLQHPPAAPQWYQQSNCLQVLSSFLSPSETSPAKSTATEAD